MRHALLTVLLCAALTAPGQAQNASVGRELESILTFEATHNGTAPFGWGGGPPGTISVDGETVHGGRWSVRLERNATNAGQPFSALTRSIPIEFSGTTIEWRGFLRSENVSEFMALWMRQDGDTPNLAFATMQPAANQRNPFGRDLGHASLGLRPLPRAAGYSRGSQSRGRGGNPCRPGSSARIAAGL